MADYKNLGDFFGISEFLDSGEKEPCHGNDGQVTVSKRFIHKKRSLKHFTRTWMLATAFLWVILPSANAADYSAYCKACCSVCQCTPTSPITVPQGEPFSITYGGGVPCDNGPICAGATFTATMKENIFFGPEQEFDTFFAAAGLGLQRDLLIDSSELEGTDHVILELTSSQTGNAVLAHCDFQLTVDPAPESPALTSPTHALGQASCNQTLTLEWEPPAAPRGIAGYSYVIVSQDDPYWELNRWPDDTIDLDASTTAFTSEPLAPGQVWEFNILTIDSEGLSSHLYASFLAWMDTCSIDITRPHFGDFFDVGEWVNIFWDPVTYDGNDVSGGYDVETIDLLKGPEFVRTLVSNQVNILWAGFSVPGVESGSNYNLRITLDRNSSGDLFPELPEALIGFSDEFGILQPDNDNDGITDRIDGSFEDSVFTDEQTFYSDSFTDEHLALGYSFGSILYRDCLDVRVEDLEGPEGFLVSAITSNPDDPGCVGDLEYLNVCGFPIRLVPGSVFKVTCGSISVEVLTGPIEVLLSSGLIVRIPSRTKVRVTEVAPKEFLVENFSEGSGNGTVAIESDGSVTAVLDPNQSITILSNRAPVAAAGADATVECTGFNGASVELDGSASWDADSDPLALEWQGPFLEGGGTVYGDTPIVTLPLGSHNIFLTVDDGYGGSDTDSVTISVYDASPPVIALSVKQLQLWPPNHVYIDTEVNLSDITVSDICDSLPSAHYYLFSDEPDNGEDDGDTNCDALFDNSGTIRVRRERAGTGDGRVYTLHVTAVDATGNLTEKSAPIASVPLRDVTGAVNSGVHYSPNCN